MSTSYGTEPEIERRESWTRHPMAVAGVTAAATIIGAVIAAVVAHSNGNLSLGPMPTVTTTVAGPTVTETATPTVTETVTPTASPIEEPSPSPGDPVASQVRRTGTVTIPDGRGADLDSKDVQWGLLSNSGFDFSVRAPISDNGNHPTLYPAFGAVVKRGKTRCPDITGYTENKIALDDHPGPICVISSEGRFAEVTIKSINRLNAVAFLKVFDPPKP